MAPDPDSFDGMVILICVLLGTLVTINFLSSKSDAPKLDPVIVVKLSSKTISCGLIVWPLGKFIVTTADPFSVVNAPVSVVVDLIGCIS